MASDAAHSDLAALGLRSRPSILSVDSGYGSATSPTASSFRSDWALRDAYEHWKVADEAGQQFIEEDRAVEEAIISLRAARKAASQVQLNPAVKKKKSLLNIFRNKSKVNLAISQPSTAELISKTTDIPTLEKHLRQLRTQKEATELVAKKLDECFNALRNVVQSSSASHIWRASVDSTATYSTSNEDPLLRAEKSVVTRDDAYTESARTSEAMRHARIAIQSAHHHYSQAMDISEGICSPKKSVFEAIMGDEQSREETYREAANWARKAQVCFNESLRVLQPHMEIVPERLLPALDELKEAGLLQSLRIYDLMYGGKSMVFGIKDQVSVMLNKQDAIFARLTDFAVWIQNETTDCESVEREALQARNNARRTLVQLWMSNCGWPGPDRSHSLAPSIS